MEERKDTNLEYINKIYRYMKNGMSIEDFMAKFHLNYSEFSGILELCRIYDKNIDKQLSLYDFENTPIKKLDLETIEFLNSKFLTEKDLEANNCILKKVRQINK